MDRIDRLLSSFLATPYRPCDLEKHDEQPHFDDNGLLTFSPNDPEDPKTWSSARRWYISLVTILLVVNATFASSSPSACLPSISQELHVSPEAAALVITVFLIANAGSPFLWAPLSEHYGRRWVFYGTFLCYFIFNFLCAWAPNFGALLVGRFFTGIFASSTQSNAPGLLADIWGPMERGNAMALFSVMVFVGPALGPVISGFLQLKKDWRWVFYVLLWAAGGTMPLMFTIPETHPGQILTNKAKRLRRSGLRDVKAPAEVSDRTLKYLFGTALTRPWAILINPISLCCAIYTALVYMLLYMLFSLYPIVFRQMRGWNSGVAELPLIGTITGACIGGLINFYFTVQDRKERQAGIPRVPEDRLVVAKIGGIIFPISMFWFAWTAQYNSIHWISPTLAGVLLCVAIVLIFVAYLNYLVDTYITYAASALAANAVLRLACGAAAPLFTPYMFESLTVAGGGSLIGGVAILLAPIPFVFTRYGATLRARSKFAASDPPPANDIAARSESRSTESGKDEES
ncbi:Major facilitator superfamily multidrug transporter mdrA [Fulvia fulva]|uniref:Cercosporin MFS transporter CTB4 n=1 Tax=Passalora fulva TaxID=5499 RepID=A0A9Q8LEF3_PASFU|nr:Major facilitator superfamily multidrug transporter mdrA [Fulvia fulva]KAK4629332.1 Major facilitator superfamily multidrug transporter mdrA [Fulvia fulva]KAK4630126.1 Major facilitator superfamily multidrug transporter mdrA [Fulvia fulva]UJO15173.1 Major facilitator superfamily multidrug transporter mdrA [Fulvia fulva]WPV12867.1 Major facilitator superfamily multidrug transporter mdrA [Fulvia fulva]WPV27072.1 Major facilitator superfamily multidrug transporter mdrA [Fulvia fulva]